MTLSVTAVIAPSAKSRLSGSPPEADRHVTRPSKPWTGARNSNTAKVKTRYLAPRERGRLSLDRHQHPFAIGLHDFAEDLIADQEPSLILLDIELETRRRLRKASQLQVVDMADRHLGRVRHRRLGSGGGARQPECDERALGPFSVDQFLPVDGDLGLLGAELEHESMPPRRSCQPLHGDGGPFGISTAKLSSAQPGMTLKSEGPDGPWNVSSIDHFRPGATDPSSWYASSSRPAVSGSSRLCESDAPPDGIRKLFRSLARGSSTSDTLPDFIQRDGSNDSKLSTNTRATRALKNHLHTRPRERYLRPLPAHSRRTAVGLIDRSVPESRSGTREERKSGGPATESRLVPFPWTIEPTSSPRAASRPR